MTSVMRAVSLPNAPRVPRVAVVHEGSIVEERLVRARTSVTIGSSEGAMFVVRHAPLPASFPLLELVGDTYWLRFTDAMSGRVALATGPMDLAALKSVAHAAQGAYRVKLTDDARGKIVIGDTTFLFQIVPCPPAPARPKLPLGVMTGAAGRIDWSLTIVAAFSFLLHFGIVGATYSDWMDPVIDADRAVAGIIEMSKHLDNVPVESHDPAQPSVATSQPTQTTANPTSTSSSTKTATRTSTTKTTHTSTTTSGGVSDAEAARLAQRANEMGMDLLGAKNQGPAVANVLSRASEIPPVDLSKSAAENSSIATTSDNGLRVAPGGPVARRSSGLPGIAGDRTSSNGTQNAGPERNVAGPTLVVDTQPAQPSVPMSDADRVIATLRPRFRKCYETGLASDPTMQGRTVLVADVAPNGEVRAVSVAENQGLSSGVNACLSRTLGNAQFTGNGSGAKVRVPVAFFQQAGR